MSQPHSVFSDLLTAAQVATDLGVSKRTLQRWGRLRKGPPRIKIGRLVYFRRDAVLSWLVNLESCNNVAKVGGRP